MKTKAEERLEQLEKHYAELKATVDKMVVVIPPGEYWVGTTVNPPTVSFTPIVPPPPFKFEVGQEVRAEGNLTVGVVDLREYCHDENYKRYRVSFPFGHAWCPESYLSPATPPPRFVEIEAVERKKVRVEMKPGMVVAESSWGSWKGTTAYGKPYGRILGHEGLWVRIIEGDPLSVYEEKQQYERECGQPFGIVEYRTTEHR